MQRKRLASLITTLRDWAQQPYRTAAFFALLMIVAISGPWACVVHCLMLDAGRPGLHHMHDAHTLPPRGSADSACPTVMNGSVPMAHEAPSALTVAIVLLVLLIPMLRAQMIHRTHSRIQSASIEHPPPRRPPRVSICFAA